GIPRCPRAVAAVGSAADASSTSWLLAFFRKLALHTRAASACRTDDAARTWGRFRLVCSVSNNNTPDGAPVPDPQPEAHSFMSIDARAGHSVSGCGGQLQPPAAGTFGTPALPPPYARRRGR